MKKIAFILLLLTFTVGNVWAQKTATEWFYHAKKYDDNLQYEQALYGYNQAVTISPDFAGAYNNRGVVHAKMGDHEEAVKDYLKSIELGHPIPGIPWFNLGHSLEELGRCSEAYEAYRQARDQPVLIEVNELDLNEGLARLLIRCRA